MNGYRKMLYLENMQKNLLTTSYLLNSFISSSRSYSENLSQYCSSNYANNSKRPIILVADDNHIINESNKRILMNICREKSLNYEIVSCQDGIDILKYVSDESSFGDIKIIITDENMEYLNGSEAIRIIRTLEDRKRAPKKVIISLTCHEELSILKNIKESGADLIITKPLSKQKIIHIFETD